MASTIADHRGSGWTGGDQRSRNGSAGSAVISTVDASIGLAVSDWAGATPADDLADLYRRHRRSLVGLATAIVFDAAVAEEVVQDAFLGLHRRGAHSVADAGAYLHRAVVNGCVSVVRRRRTVAAHPPVPLEPASTPEVDEAWQAIMGLPERQRVVVVLRYYRDLSVPQIAESLGWPAGSVKSTLHRALASLKEVLR